MVIDGMGSQAIANQLTADNVLIPSAYLEQSEHGESRNHSYHDPCRWNCTAVSYILDKQEYMGHTVLGKTICENFKTKKRRKARPDELIIFMITLAGLMFGVCTGMEALKMLAVSFAIFIIPQIAEWLIERIVDINYGLRDFIKS